MKKLHTTLGIIQQGKTPKTKSMKKSILLCVMLMVFTFAKGQDASVEKSIFGIQIGLFGIWGHNEFKMSNELAFRSEIGMEGGVWGGTYYEGTGFLLTPSLAIEPRWYYNMNKRVSKEKRIDGNSANFLSLRINYHPDWFVISNQDVDVVSDISIIPSWGLRRNLGQHFNFETGVGLGYIYYFAKNAGYGENEGDVIINILLKIGYKFKPKKITVDNTPSS